MNRALQAIWDEHARPAIGDPAHPPPVVLVVGHGGSLRAFVCRALGVGHEHIRRFRLDNAGLSIAEFWGPSLEQSAGRIALLNDTAHLAP
jgi:broad specificity phosphatase PhoE